jgi:hypothetical protein
MSKSVISPEQPQLHQTFKLMFNDPAQNAIQWCLARHICRLSIVVVSISPPSPSFKFRKAVAARCSNSRANDNWTWSRGRQPYLVGKPKPKATSCSEKEVQLFPGMIVDENVPESGQTGRRAGTAPHRPMEWDGRSVRLLHEIGGRSARPDDSQLASIHFTLHITT